MAMNVEPEQCPDALRVAREAVRELPAPTSAAEAARAGALAWLNVYERVAAEGQSSDGGPS